MHTQTAITLLAVVRANFPADSDLGHIDPTLFLSVYLVTYPILQWSLGGWILAPGDDDKKDERSVVASVTESIKRIIQHPTAKPAHYRNVLNNKYLVQAQSVRTKGLTSTDEGCYMTELDLQKLGEDETQKEHRLSKLKKLEEEAWQNEYIQRIKYSREDTLSSNGDEETCPLMDSPGFRMYDEGLGKQDIDAIVEDIPPLMPAASRRNLKSERTMASQYESDNFWETVKNILDRTLFQPPVVGALLGILCAITPARGSFVDLVNRHR